MTVQKPTLVTYTSARRVGNLIFTSGHLPVDANGKLVDGSIKEQTAQVMRNLQATLKAEGSGLDRVIKATVLLRHRSDWEGMNEVYAQFMGDNKPARTAITAGDMKFGALLEMEVVAKGGGGT